MTGSLNPCIECGKPTMRYPHAKRCHPCAGIVAKEQACAIGAVKRLVAKGTIEKPLAYRCVDCGGQALNYDHRDYAKPWQIEPVCIPCNIKRGPAVTPK